MKSELYFNQEEIEHRAEENSKIYWNGATLWPFYRISIFSFEVQETPEESYNW